MFKKITERISTAARNTSNRFNHDKVNRLCNMGFSPEEARNALTATDGDVDRAAELLLVSSSSAASLDADVVTPSHGSSPSGNGDDDDEEMRRVMEESLQAEEERRLREATEASQKTTTTTRREQSAASNAAGRAALARFEATTTSTSKKKKNKKTADRISGPPTTKSEIKKQLLLQDNNTPSTSSTEVSSHHPKVTIPPPLQNKSKEEQILRCTNRLSTHPRAVDTLLVALTSIRDHPENDKYRKIDKTSKGYQTVLEGKAGAEDLLLAMNFRKRNRHDLVLNRDDVDAALLYLGISALEGVRVTSEYKDAKNRMNFEKEVLAMRIESDMNEAEALKRADLLSKCPSEPPAGRGALVTVNLTQDVKLSRRFDGDDVLIDVIRWIASNVGSDMMDRVLLRKEWCIVDMNRYPIQPMQVGSLDLNKTLQVVGCWPSGRLELRPSPEGWSVDHGKKSGSE